MRIIKFIFSLLIAFSLLYFLNSSHKIDKLPLAIPPLGKLMNPFTGIWQNAENVTDFQDENLHFPQLKDEVNVAYDERMVPHIFAENDVDLAFVEGYVMAQHRLWQMDFLRETLLRLIQSIPSKSVEPFKMWLVNAGEQNIQETENPDLMISKLMDSYHA